MFKNHCILLRMVTKNSSCEPKVTMFPANHTVLFRSLDLMTYCYDFVFLLKEQAETGGLLTDFPNVSVPKT